MTLTVAWARTWAGHPSSLVLVDGGTGAAWDASAVDAATADRAGRLAAAGVGPGDRVLLSCASSIDTVLAYVAILRLGAVVVPANTAYTAPELGHIVDDVRPALAVCDEPGRAGSVASTTPDLAALPAGQHVELDVAAADDLAMIAYTSGTTGRPKGAMLTHGNLLAGALALVEAWEWTPEDRLVHALPMFHMHGLGAALNGSLTAGASLAVLTRFSPEAVADAATDASLFFGVPTMYARLRDTGLLPRLSHLRLLVSGSAPLDPVLFEAVRAGTGQAPLERYGMSETVMLTSNPVRGERRPGSVGRPLPGVDLRLGDGGAVEVRGPSVFRGYWERPGATADAFTADGWFRTGDVGELDDGYLRLVGRASDLIITGGYNVYPREVEDAVLEHPAVLDCAVVGIPDETWGEKVAAFVEVAPGTDLRHLADLLDAHVEPRLAPFKRPRAWHVVATLPRNAMGKVQRDRLGPPDQSLPV